MPLPNDEQLIASAKDVIAEFKTIFGAHPGFRPAHAKGAILTGTFTPSGAASKYTNAAHLTSTKFTPITVRFSSSTGIPQIPDNNENANPRGLALRFHLPDVNGRRAHTDIVSHSTPFFPAHNGEEFLGFLKAIAASPPGSASPSPIETFLGSHPAALAHVQAPKPFPVSLATEEYYSVTAFKLVDTAGKQTYFRYKYVPDVPVATLTSAEVEAKSPTYLFDELLERIAKGSVSFKLLAQIAEAGDEVNDATVHWPESREFIELGKVVLDKFVEDSAQEQKAIIFDPIPRVVGVEASEDPLLEFRAALYLISGRERRAA